MTIRAFITGLRRGIPAPAGMRGRCPWFVAGVITWAWLATSSLGLGADAEPAAEPIDDGVFLPTDRELERSLDKARRLLSDGRWSDAATLFDEILAAPRDAFGTAAPGRATSRSLKTEAWAVLLDQPRAGRDAYDLLFSARAERHLADAIMADDMEAVVDVARRWFATPAGRRAAVIAAITALEAEQPAVAAAWLDRLAEQKAGEPVEPTLSLMRSIAHAEAGDMATALAILDTARGRDRVAGEEITLSLPPARVAAWLGGIVRSRAARADEWPQPRGDAARNATVVASRPLLVPRYRVPLARHPEEVRLLDKRRQVAAAAERFVMPAGTPVAIDGLILVRTPLGILAVDFVTGKRVWLRPLDDQGPGWSLAEPGGAGADEPGGDTTEFTFDDLTSAGLTAAGGLVFAVESPPPVVGDRGPLGDFNAAPRPRRLGDSGRRGNRLRAFDIATRGAARWQLPAADSDAWYLGPPLAVGRELYVLVEEKGEVRLDVLSAARGTVVWSQPLAELDEDEQISSQRSRPRRLAGLSPALSDGVLVCPLGTGTVVAVDLATRRLLWAHRYARVDRPDTDRPGGPDTATGSRRGGAAGDSLPVLAAGRVFMAAPDAAGLICLDLRQGRPAWETAVPGVVQVAGVVDDRVIVIGQRRVEARRVADGGLLWQVSYADAGGRPSGRGILTPDRLFLPLDSPEVVEIDLRSGAITGRCPARGGLVPGNLVAYRGEVISRGSDSLDVFHQTAALDTRIRTAEARDPESPWVWQWRGHLALEEGRVADGLSLLGKAARAGGHRLPPETLPDAIVFGMQRDFAAAAPAWREAFRMASLAPGGSAAARAAARVAVDGFLRAESWNDAWAAIQDLLVNDPAGGAATRDPADPAVVVSDDRWLAGRLAAVIDRSPPALRTEITAAAEAAVDAAAADATDRVQRLEALAERLVSLPAGRRARELTVAALEARGDDSTRAAIRREWHLLHLARSSASDARDSARTAVVASRPEGLRSRGDAVSTDRDWPLGRVDYRRLPIGRDTFAGEGRSRLMPLPVDVDRDAAVPGLRLACDVQEGRLHVFDGYGRPLLDPLAIDPAGARLGLPWLPQANGFEAWTLGRLLVVRTGRTLSAYDLGGGSRAVWTHAIAGSAADQQPAGLWVRDVGGRGGRHGGNPLGLEITEPDDRSRTGQPRGGRPRITGALHHAGGTVSLVDPCTGTPLWERHALPAASELVGDDEFVTVCTASGADSRVLSMLDGHLVRTVTVPPRRQRLATSGRRIVSLRPLGDAAGRSVAATVQLELVDPVTADTTALSTVAGDARAVPLDDDRLAVLTPDGQLTVFDLAAGQRSFETRLPAMPTAFDRLHVVPWRDRLLVIAGTESQSESGEWLPGLGDLAPLQHLLAAGEISRPLSGALWAVDSDDGRLLWPGPATLDRHSLHLAQPAGLPVLLLSRQARSRPDAEEVRLSLVGLDKRTGHAVFEEAAQPIRAHVFFGCELVGDPDRHSITVRESGETPRWAVLEFTGGQMPPRPPYQARRPMPDMDRLIEQMHSWRRQRP